MTKRDFLRSLAGIAAAPVAVAVVLAKPKLKRNTMMAENFRRIYGAPVSKGWKKTPYAKVDFTNFERQMRTAMLEQQAMEIRMIALMESNGFRFAGRVHDSIEFEMPKGARS